MDVEDEALLFRTNWGDDEEEEEEEEEEEDGGTRATGQSCLSGGAGLCGLWKGVGWVYTQPWASGVVLGVAFLMPCALFAYMLLYCPPLDIDLSYSAFEVHSHFSAERFDALTIAVKTQLGSWDRRRRDVDDVESEALKELLLEKLGENEAFNGTAGKRVKSSFPADSTLRTGDDRRGETSRESDSSQEGIRRDERRSPRAEEEPGLWDGNSSFSLNRRRRFAPNYYMQSQALWRIELVFVAQGKGERNIFTPERLETIHRVERLLMQHPQFHQFCWKPMEILRDLPLGPSYCSPPSSLLSYLYPSERAGKIYYDGMGPDLADIQGSLSLAITHPQFYWYVDESLSPEHLSSALLRSEIHFGAPLPSYYSLQDRADEQRARFKTFVVQYAGMLAKQSTSEVKVLYGGTELFDDEVRHTFYNDMMLAVISGACITALVYILTSFSVFLTFFGLAAIGLSCLMALFLYHVVFGVRYLGILNGVAAFVIIGIGVDDVFVFISTFRQASHLRQPRERMIYTIKTAGRATFLTSFTTAAAYAANTFSQIPAVHDFGLFMALIVSCAWLWVSVVMPAALCIWTQHVEPHEHDWWNCVKLLLGLSASYSPLSDEDDDVALLSVDMEPGEIIISFTENGRQEREGMGKGTIPESLAAVVYDSLGAHAGVFLLVLVFSAGCCCLLKPATHAPLLFRQDTNLQTLLALRSNLSGQGISCPMCSGVFMEKPHQLYTHLCKNELPYANVPGLMLSWFWVLDSMLTVYMSKLVQGGSTTIYRFSLNTSVPSLWKVCSAEHDEVSSFQVWERTKPPLKTICDSGCQNSILFSPSSWMITSGSCDHRHGWTEEFSFYVASSPQQNSRRLYFAQCRQRPHPSRLCVKTPGCGFSSGPDGPLKGYFYTPSSAAKTKASKTSGFNPCSGGACGRPAVRPLVDTGAMVFVVFGILGVNRSENRENHVIGDMGSVILDPDFDIFKEMGHLCKICKVVGANRKLVKPGGAQCLPSGNKLSSVLPLLHPECHSLPEPNLLPGQLSHGAVGMHGGKVRWLSMAFESTTYKGKSSFQTYSDFLQWENFIQEQLASLPQTSALQRGFQTCEHWKQIFMEIIGVESALSSLLLSLAICVAAVSVFTAHHLLLLPVLITIIGVICLVVAVMYWLGWEMGAVEAISLSILVGSSVDYCLHLVEGYLLAGETEPSAERQRRTLEAVNHVGVAIVSSAVTTAISTVPLFFCVIVPFAKFGQIVAINTAVSILFTLSVTSALLSCMAPAHFSRHAGAVLKASLAVTAAAAVGGCCVLLVFTARAARSHL
uniref:Dispatched RND transporter family member 3 n=1 Tax=Fundulus heteroclitus TaxID=8078 RepID=A0A3Q2QZD5_FUNHE